MQVYFVRHGCTDLVGQSLAGRMPGVFLNDEGRRQADRLAESFADAAITGVHCSPAERAQQTAEPIGLRLELPVQIAPALNEIDFGEWTGESFETLRGRPDWDRWNSVRSCQRPPGGETMLQAQARMAEYVQRLLEEDGSGRHLLIGHADPIKATISFYLGLSLDLIDRIEVSPASVSAVELNQGCPRLLYLNRTMDG